MRKLGYGFAVAAAAMTASSASAAVLLSDDMSTNANWGVVASADSLATFGFDYSTVGVPMAPGAANTLALKLEANNGDAVTGAERIAAVSNANFAGTYQVSYSFWANYNGELGLGGSGSTEFIGGAIGHDGVTNALDSGANLIWTGDAGSGTDLRAHKDGVLLATASQLPKYGYNTAFINANHDGIAGAGLYPSVGAPAAQLALFPGQINFTRPGSAGFAWHEAVITVIGGAATFHVDGIRVVTIDQTVGQGNGAYSTSGKVGLLYADLFASVSGNPAMSFGLFTNVEVTDVPEPASLALMGLGGLMMLRRR